MSIYYPELLDMRRAESDMFEAYLPTVPDPLDVKDTDTETEAAERVATYLYRAKGDPGTAHLQWHECSVQIHPWSIGLLRSFRTVEWWFSLRCRCQRLVTVVDLVGPSVIEGGVAPAAVVEALDISDDIAPGLGLGGVYGAVDPLVLQR